MRVVAVIAVGLAFAVAVAVAVVGEAAAQRAATPASPVTIARPRIRGPVERVLVERTLRRHLNQFAYCYERARQRDPELAGRLRATFLILPTGATDGGAAGVDNELENCAARIVRRLRFPAAAAGSQVQVDLVLRAPRPPRPPRAAPGALRELLGGPCVGCGLGCTCPCACPGAMPGCGPGTSGCGL